MIDREGSNVGERHEGHNTGISIPNPSHSLLQEAMTEARKIRDDVKSGNTKALEQDAKEINSSKYNKQDGLYQMAIREDLHALGLPNVIIEGGNEGAEGKPFTDIMVDTKTKDGGDKITSYWAGADTTKDGPNSVGTSSETFDPHSGSSASPAQNAQAK